MAGFLQKNLAKDFFNDIGVFAMAKNFIKTLAFVGALSMAGSAHALLVVSSGQTADNLVNSLLAGSSGITTSNATLVGTSVMNGTFSGGTSASLGFDQKICIGIRQLAVNLHHARDDLKAGDFSGGGVHGRNTSAN